MRTNQLRSALFLLVIFASVSMSSCRESAKVNGQGQKEDSKIFENPPWAIALIDAYRAFDKNRDTQSADLVFEATEGMPKKNWENYLVCATIYAPNDEPDKAFLAIEKAIETGLRDTNLLNTIPGFSSLRQDTRWAALVAKTEEKRKAYLNSIENPKLLVTLESMWAADQAALSEYEKYSALLDSTATSEDYDRLFESVERRWEINKNKLDSIITIHGWPGNRLVGEDGAKISWAIPQHHPDVFFKEDCLLLIKKAVEEKDMDPNHYAELKDRIARDTWQKQTYGASMGQQAPYPIKDAAYVNKRRFDIGLVEPVEVYAYYHGITYESPTEEKARLQAKTVFEEAQSNYVAFEQFLNTQEIDSALAYLKKSIAAHGDLDNEQLYEASIKLARQENKQCHRLSLKLLKVLVWRRWDKRFEVMDNDVYSHFSEEERNEIIGLLERSMKSK